MRQATIATLTTIAILSGLAEQACADVPDVPGDDIFGFTTPTDLGNPGDAGYVNENDGHAGKRSGRYRVFNAKYELGLTIAPDWWIGGAVYASHHYSRNAPDLNNVNRFDFDGVSFEIAHRLIKRSAANPFAVAVSAEPRLGRVDSVSGLPSQSMNVSFKLFVDAVIVENQWFWAANVAWTPERAEDFSDRNRWVSSSEMLISTALTYQMSPTLFVGVEGRFLASFNSLLPTDEAGRALYLGPTLLWKITDKVAFNTTFQPQIAGQSVSSPGRRLDLDNFERAQFRAKLSVAFQ